MRISLALKPHSGPRLTISVSRFVFFDLFGNVPRFDQAAFSFP